MDYKKNYLQEKKRADILEVQLLQNRYQVLIAEIKEVTKELEDIDKKEKEQAKNNKEDSTATKT